MGRMAELAERHYREFLPTAYAKIADKPGFFQMLEDTAQEQIDSLVDSLTEPPTPGETYQDAVARQTTARQMAESQVFREVLMPEPESTGEPESDPATDAELTAALTEFREAKDSLAPPTPPGPPPTPAP